MKFINNHARLTGHRVLHGFQEEKPSTVHVFMPAGHFHCAPYTNRRYGTLLLPRIHGIRFKTANLSFAVGTRKLFEIVNGDRTKIIGEDRKRSA